MKKAGTDRPYSRNDGTRSYGSMGRWDLAATDAPAKLSFPLFSRMFFAVNFCFTGPFFEVPAVFALVPDGIELFGVGLWGLVLGSHAGLLSWRLPKGQPIGADRSHCDMCGRTLKPLDLVPVFSWLARRGRCGCGQFRISSRYPLIESAVTAACLLAWFMLGISPALALASFFALGMATFVQILIEQDFKLPRTRGVLSLSVLLLLASLVWSWVRWHQYAPSPPFCTAAPQGAAVSFEHAVMLCYVAAIVVFGGYWRQFVASALLLATLFWVMWAPFGLQIFTLMAAPLLISLILSKRSGPARIGLLLMAPSIYVLGMMGK